MLLRRVDGQGVTVKCGNSTLNVGFSLTVVELGLLLSSLASFILLKM